MTKYSGSKTATKNHGESFFTYNYEISMTSFDTWAVRTLDTFFQIDELDSEMAF